VTVAGLLTGRDIVRALQGRDLGEVVIIPDSCIRQGESVFLDDLTLSEMSSTLGRPVETVGISGKEIAEAFTGKPLRPAGRHPGGRRPAGPGSGKNCQSEGSDKP